MFRLVKIEPVSKEINQLNNSCFGSLRVMSSCSSFVRGVRAEDFNLQIVETEKTKRKWEIESQAVVLDLRRQSSKLPDRLEIKHRRIDAVSAQQLRFLLPARQQLRMLQPGSNNRVDTTCDHQFLTIS